MQAVSQSQRCKYLSQAAKKPVGVGMVHRYILYVAVDEEESEAYKEAQKSPLSSCFQYGLR